MFSFSVAVGLLTTLIVYVLLKSYTRPSVSMIRGPKSPSFIFGNLLEVFQRPVGEAEFAWQNQYGNVVRFKSVLGEDGLLITDPKALQKILNTSAYSFVRSPVVQVIARVLHGKGIVMFEGDDHKRQRSIMIPGFGPAETKAYLPIFKDCAESVSIKWSEIIGTGNGQRVVIDILPWLSRGALDGICQAAFDVQIDSIQDDSHPLVANVSQNRFGDIYCVSSATQIFLLAAWRYIPMRLFEWAMERTSDPRIVHARNARILVADFAKELVREKAHSLLLGKGSKDVFTLLIKANMDAEAKKRLSDEELFGQMSTLLSAGHETTSLTLSWMLLELARNPEVQSRLRDEIKKTEAVINARGDSQLTAADLDDMPYLNAVVKEGLRFHPMGAHTLRVACHDEILPLSKPLLTKSGDTIHELLVPKGTNIMASIATYNRNKDLWGEDAHEFKPDRWLDGAADMKLPSIGVYSNLLTFLSGPRACLGWRFAVIEIQVFLWTLVAKFEFATTDKAERILRQPAVMMVPMVDGELERGGQMPLAVSLVPQDGEA